MRVFKYTDTDFETNIRSLIERPPVDPEIERAVEIILRDVKDRGDDALCDYALKYDGASLTPDTFLVSEEEMTAAKTQVPANIRKAIRTAHRQIKDFSSQQRPKPWSYTPRPGVVLGERFTPMSRVACYVPGGTAPLVSTVLHTVTLAAVAGVPEIVVITPPGKDGSVNPAILYAARKAGATTVCRLGGVYGVAAMAYGTRTIRKVEKIVGPGNAYVTAAKRQVYGHVSLDMVAGPSEIMVLADDTARADFIAADMLSQIEHGSGKENAVMVTTCPELIEAVGTELRRQSAERSRGATIETCLETGTFLVLAEDRDAMADIASRYAPEHLEIMTRNAGALAKKVTAAGAVFLGKWTPEPAGDFVAGPSHVLPTGGAARFFNGLTVDQFYRRMSVVKYQKNAFAKELDTISAFAEIEGLDAHGHSAALRCQKEA
ncbi:MAG: histidinol dehydrogenase [Lentisphaeria bacterium]|nr:histidinol dehydrogenase [Lentisphaeria bacterium]